MKIIIISIGLVLLSTISQFIDQQTYCPDCKNEDTVKLTHYNFTERIVEKVEPVFPPGCRCRGKVVAKVVVNKIGEVEEVKIQTNNNLLRYYVHKALLKWKFRPLIKDEKKSCFTGEVVYTYD